MHFAWPFSSQPPQKNPLIHVYYSTYFQAHSHPITSFSFWPQHSLYKMTLFFTWITPDGWALWLFYLITCKLIQVTLDRPGSTGMNTTPTKKKKKKKKKSFYSPCFAMKYPWMVKLPYLLLDLVIDLTHSRNLLFTWSSETVIGKHVNQH